MIAYIPVKASERLPGKHLMKICGRPMLDIVREKLSEIGEVVILSKIDLPFPYKQDNSENIMQLVHELSLKNDSFMLIAGDMPFFTVGDLNVLLSHFSGESIMPVHKDGKMEPLFAIYSGPLETGSNLRIMLRKSGFVAIDSGLFSKRAFFNVNTQSDLSKANEICKSLLQ
ncbi:MAG: NTP transferase domain-containing protein [Thermoplasmataceae archaeon]|jgi:molybdopterin-guanine dinucleotide biosynthesis protein A